MLWGFLHGCLLALERPFLPLLQSIDSIWFRAARAGVVFIGVSMLWIFFKLPDFNHAWGYLVGMFRPGTNPNPTKLFYDLAIIYSLPVIVQHLGYHKLLEPRLRVVEPYLYGAMAALAYLEAGPESAFIYFQF
jgi:alginate O-acetyltransferase complex protein AlgI